MLDATATASLLDFGRLVGEVERAAIERDAGEIVCPDRQVVPLAGNATMLSMPAVARDVAIHKLITVAPGTAARGLATIQGTMTVFDPVTARPMLVLDGPTVTAMRTAAVSMCAWRRLAADDANRILLIGTGVQAAFHLRAIASLRPDCRVRVRGTSPTRAIAFCEANRTRLVDLAPDDDERPDVVITVTTSEVPVWREPAHIETLVIAVGSFRPQIAEIAAETVRGSAVLVDDPVGATHEAGDLIGAGVDWSDVRSLADLVRGDLPPSNRAVLFKSVGCAAWDLAAARVAVAALR